MFKASRRRLLAPQVRTKGQVSLVLEGSDLHGKTNPFVNKYVKLQMAWSGSKTGREISLSMGTMY